MGDLHKKVLILTRSDWYEPPRMRKQFSKLFLSLGFQVHYINVRLCRKPDYLNHDTENLFLYNLTELIDFRYRYGSVLNFCNKWVLESQFKRIVDDVQPALIINFNADAPLIIFSFNIPVWTFINDDFIAQAKLFMKHEVRKRYSRILPLSQKVLTVSYPLHKQLSKYNMNTDVFFPWSSTVIKQKEFTGRRILFFGFIHRIPNLLVSNVIVNSDYHFDFIGPIKDHKFYEMVKDFDNVSFIGSQDITQINSEDYFCSYLPYDLENPNNLQITVSNRFFQLLALGLPLVISNLPHLIQGGGGFIFKVDHDYINHIRAFKLAESSVIEMQPRIAKFLEAHTKDQRKASLKEMLQSSGIL